MNRLPMFVLLLTLATACSACGRASITFNLNAQPGVLEETTVIAGPGSGGSEKIVLIDVRGIIVDAQQRGLLSPSSNPVDDLAARLDKAARDSDVRAIVLRINSPGGSVGASETMYREVRRFREQTGKPVIVSMGEVAASGGYYLALAGDTIYAQPTTITGSIGVIIPTINVSQGLQRIGIVSRSIKSGENKDLANPLEPMRESQYAVLQGMVDEFYDRFRSLVLERRAAAGIGPADASTLMDGRVMTGSTAARAGVIDHEGDLREAFEAARSMAGVPRAKLIKYHDEGDSPRSIYAAASTAAAAPSQGGGPTEINLVQIQLGDGTAAGLQVGTTAYYLWTIGLP